MNKKYLLVVFILACIIGIGTLWFSNRIEVSFFNSSIERQISETDQFRDSIIRFLRQTAGAYFSGEDINYPQGLEIESDWDVYVTTYYQGEKGIRSRGKGDLLSLALEDSVNNLLKTGIFKQEDLEEIRFFVELPLSDNNYFSFIEHNGRGKEVIDELVVIRELDKDIILEMIQQGKEFLYRMENQDEHGFYKKYEALTDSFEDRVHTVYSASIIYTFLYIYDLEKDEEILTHLSDWADFLLFMQNKDQEDKRYGAFSYSYYFNTREKEQRYVVGTSALSIFTLLRLYDLTGEERYLDSAKLAGDWLITMQKEDGVMKAYTRYSDGRWVYGTKESLLYNGQVLSSLSKLYGATQEKKYYDAAKRIADHFAGKYEAVRGYVEGEYRTKNPISNSWIVMSLQDFHKVDGSDRYKDIVFELSSMVLKNQNTDPKDVLFNGIWNKAYSTSGIGWISEVMSETYRFCLDQERNDCENYKEAVVRGIRWIIQNTYSEENNFLPQNQERSLGGVFWNKDARYVRTDSVCHAVNGYVRIMDYLDEGNLVSLPERSFKEILKDLRGSF